jgi:predicted nucleic acid-binding protein
VAFVSGTSVKELYVSSVTLAEIRFGIEKATDPNDRVILTHWLTHTVRPMLTGWVLDVTEDIMLEWRLLVEEGRKINTFSQPDLFIAAIALHHDLTIVYAQSKRFRQDARADFQSVLRVNAREAGRGYL